MLLERRFRTNGSQNLYPILSRSLSTSWTENYPRGFSETSCTSIPASRGLPFPRYAAFSRNPMAMAPLSGATSDVDSFGLKGLLFSRLGFESFGCKDYRYPAVALRANDEEIITSCQFSRTRSKNEIQLLRNSFYTEPLEDPVPEEEEVGVHLQITSASDATTAEWPPTKSPASILHTAIEERPNTAIFNLNAQQAGSGDGESPNHDLADQAAVAVLRHGQRQDSVFGSSWHNTMDFQQYPFDCPITDDAVVQARHAASKLSSFADFDVIVSSPYLRCVQTAIALADALDVMVILDYELGEVFGPVVFGDVDPAGRAWRSRQELHTALANCPNFSKAFRSHRLSECVGKGSWAAHPAGAKS